MMIQDPYKALNISHDASAEQIKRSYRDLARKYHPDRLLASQNELSESEKQASTARFADISAAYALLSDPKRKAQYDHIYKFGGFDNNDEEDDIVDRSDTRPSGSEGRSSPPFEPYQHSSSSRKRKSMGVGYTCVDPLAFLWSQGRIHLTQTVAGVEIPTRLQMAQPGRGLRFAYSSGQYAACQSSGKKIYTCKTTHFAQGKKYTRTETTILHPDGQRETVIEGNDCVERRYFSPAVHQHHGASKSGDNVAQKHDEGNRLPWYMNAWHGIKDKLTMCYSPCVVAAQ